MTIVTSRSSTLDAHQRLREAHEGAYRFPVGFGGFTAQLTYEEFGLSVTGLISVRAPRDIHFDIDAPEQVAGWIRQELGSMAGHRWPTSYEQGDGRYELSIEEEDHPLGPLLRMNNDPFTSSYRVLEGRITQVTREMGPMRFSISIQAQTTVSDGRVLPVSFMVNYWSLESERLTRADAYTDQYLDVEGIQLPSSRRVVTADDQGLRVRQLTLGDHRLLAPADHPENESATDAPRHGTRAG